MKKVSPFLIKTFQCWHYCRAPHFTLLHLLPPPPPLAFTTLLSMYMGYAYMFFIQSLHLLYPVTPTPHHSGIHHSVPCIHAFCSILFISLFWDEALNRKITHLKNQDSNLGLLPKLISQHQTLFCFLVQNDKIIFILISRVGVKLIIKLNQFPLAFFKMSWATKAVMIGSWVYLL